MNDPKLISITVSAAALAVVAVIAWPGEALVAFGLAVLAAMAFAGRGE
jgi:hypothetical protein